MKYRICYKKLGALIFVSQLDMQRLLQRAFRRAKLDMMFSEGYNPHPKMSYSPPLPLFVSSEEEYVDIELSGAMSAATVYTSLSDAMPKGLIINSVTQCNLAAKSLSELADWAEYELNFLCKPSAQLVADAIDEEMSKNCYTVTKLNKKKETVQRDILPLISAFKCICDEERLKVKCVLAMRNDSMLNPSTLADAIRENLPENMSAQLMNAQKIKTFINI